MKLRHILTTLITSLLLMAATDALAQASRGDKLFLEGQNLQKTMTVASQNAAIKKFQQAKVAYTAQDKKSMCDNQIDICHANIKRIRDTKHRDNKTARKESTDSVAGSKTTKSPQAGKDSSKPKRDDVQIAFSKTRLDFSYAPDEGATQTVDVECNYDDWTLDSIPAWVQVFTAPDRKSINVAVTEENTTGDYRSATVIIRCDDKLATLTVNQDKKNVGNVIKDKFNGVKGLFKKKKKKNE